MVLLILFIPVDLMRQMFSTLEDLRIDAAMRRRYPGARTDLDRVLGRALAARPSREEMTLSASLLEALVQFSLGAARADLVAACADSAERELKRLMQQWGLQCELRRIYWYTDQHDGQYPNDQVARRVIPHQQDSGASLLRTISSDLTQLVSNHACEHILLVSDDERLTPLIDQAQLHGVSVHLVCDESSRNLAKLFETDPGWTRMLEQADALASYRTYPHVDMAETGALAARLMQRRFQLGRREATRAHRLPFLIPLNAMCTQVQPARGIYEQLRALDAQHGSVLNFCMGFPAADIEHCGPVLWAHGATEDAARAAADALRAAAPAILAANAAAIEQKLGFPLRVVAVSSRSVTGKQLPPAFANVLRTADWREVVNHPDVHIVVELIGGTTTAREILEAARALFAAASMRWASWM